MTTRVRLKTRIVTVSHLQRGKQNQNYSDMFKGWDNISLDAILCRNGLSVLHLDSTTVQPRPRKTTLRHVIWHEVFLGNCARISYKLLPFTVIALFVCLFYWTSSYKSRKVGVP